MTIQSLPGGLNARIGPDWHASTPTTISSETLDAANEAVIFIGHVLTSDKGSHTIDTSGASRLGFRTGSLTFANAGTTIKVGLAAVSTAGPPGRADHASDVINFDVNAAPVGGSGGITSNAFQSITPTAGTKTIAHGDLVAFAVQMTARGGADSITVQTHASDLRGGRPNVTRYTGGSYAAAFSVPNCVITFSDGALGWFGNSLVFSTMSIRTFNNALSPNEYGQLYQFPFPVEIAGIFAWLDPDNDFDVVIYSDPLGTPVAEETVSVDSASVANANGHLHNFFFASPYTLPANTPIGAVIKPSSASNIAAYYKTMGSATHRVVDPWGLSGYGISRSGGTGAFANANSSLDHYLIGLLVGGFDAGGGGGGISRARAFSGFH